MAVTLTNYNYLNNMSDEKKRKFNKRMEALNKKYCQQLPEKFHAIEDSWNEYQANPGNENALELFYRLIHTLKGTAATFGFVRQADICLDIQKILIPIKNNDEILTNILVNKIQEHIYDLKLNINTPAQELKD